AASDLAAADEKVARLAKDYEPRITVGERGERRGGRPVPQSIGDRRRAAGNPADVVAAAIIRPVRLQPGGEIPARPQPGAATAGQQPVAQAAGGMLDRGGTAQASHKGTAG